MSAAERMAYRFRGDIGRPFWELYYPATERLTDSEILALIDTQCPGYDADALGYLVPDERDATPERRAAAAAYAGDAATRDAARLVLACHVARLYERHAPDALELAYEAALSARWRAVCDSVGVALGPDGAPVTAMTPEQSAAVDSAYDAAPFVPTPCQRAVMAARASVAGRVPAEAVGAR